MEMKHPYRKVLVDSLEDVFSNERIREPFLEYTIYKVDIDDNAKEESPHVAESLQLLKTHIENEIIFPKTREYIWTKYGMSLKLIEPSRKDHHWKLQQTPNDNDDDRPAKLYGVTRYGGNVEDEWLMISLLFEISRLHLDTAIR
jgi:hypothetical protein